MTQQARTLNDLITDACYQIGEFAVGENIDGFAIQKGVDLTNQWLDMLSNAGTNIPVLGNIEFNTEYNKQEYSISDIIPADVNSGRISDLVYAEYVQQGQSLVYPLDVIDKSSYYDNFRTNNLLARPNFLFLDKRVQESRIILYPIPDQVYEVTLQAKQYLNKMSLNTNITEIPPYMERFLRFAIARELLEFYPSSNWSDRAEKEYQSMKSQIFGSDINLAVQPSLLLEQSCWLPYPSILSLP